MIADPLLWRCYTAIDEYLADLMVALDEDSSGTGAVPVMRVVVKHAKTLGDAVQAVKDHERRDAEATGDAYERIWGPI